MTVLFMLGIVLSPSSSTAVAANEIFQVEPETASLQIERVDFASHGAPVIVRSFSRREKERGLFGAGWCSNIDVNLAGVESGSPKVIELRQCGTLKVRTFHKILDAWVEDSSSSRILKKADGRWELTEAPYPIFRHDGKLDSFSTLANVRWHVRRDSGGRPEAIDNLKTRPIKFRRNLSGDLDALLDNSGKVILRYELGLMLVKTDSRDLTESFEYDSDGNILRLLRKEPKDDRVYTWRFSYTNPEWLSAAQTPDGCTSIWLFDRSGSAAVARESKNCQKPMLNEAMRPVLAAPSKPLISRQIAASPSAISPNGGAGAKSNGVEIIKPGPMGLGKERANVSVNAEGLPIVFQIEGAIMRRLEIIRETGSGSVVLLRSGETEVNFRKKPRQYETKQLELLDEYEEWMSAWGSR